jgi:hypothetical protein
MSYGCSQALPLKEHQDFLIVSIDHASAVIEFLVADPESPLESSIPGQTQSWGPRSGEEPGHWSPWTEVLAPAPHAAPVARSGRTAAASPAKAAVASAASTTPEPAPSLFAPDPASAWQPEAAISPSEIVMGIRVRHRAKGEGTVLSVRPSGKSTELLIRFDATGEAWIVFGYGVLEFQTRAGG